VSSVCGESGYFGFVVLGAAAAAALLLILGTYLPLVSRVLVFASLLVSALYLYGVYAAYRGVLSVMGVAFAAIYLTALASPLILFVPAVFPGETGVLAYGIAGLGLFAPLAAVSYMVFRRYSRIYKVGRCCVVSSAAVSLPAVASHVFLYYRYDGPPAGALLLLLAAMCGIAVFSLAGVYTVLRSGYARLLFGLFLALGVVVGISAPIHVYIHPVPVLDSVFVAVAAAAIVLLYGLVYEAVCGLAGSLSSEFPD